MDQGAHKPQALGTVRKSRGHGHGWKDMGREREVFRVVPNNVNRMLGGFFFQGDFGLRISPQVCFVPPSWESDRVKESFSFAPFPTQVPQAYLGTQGSCRAPPGWSPPGRMCPWSWGTAENAAANQGHPQGQGSFGSRRTRTSRVSNLVSLAGKTV